MVENINADIRWFVDHLAESYDFPHVMVGFADMSLIDDISTEFVPYKHAISIAIAFDPTIVSHLKNGPTKEFFDEYVRTAEFAAVLKTKLVNYLHELGYETESVDDVKEKAIAANHSIVNDPKVSHSMSQRTMAAYSGIGWVGKNGLIITKHFGAAVMLASVFTNAPLKCSTEVFLSRCSRCMECIKSCPADALSNSEWSPDSDYRDFVDGDACKKHCRTQTLSKFGMEADVCGVCVYACPYTKSYLRRNGLSYD